MIHIAKSLAAKAVLLLLVLIILIAFVIGSLRLLTPAASYFRGAGAVGKPTGTTPGAHWRLSAQWRGWGRK